MFNDYTLEQCQKAWAQLLKKVRHYRLLIEITHDVTKIIEENDIKQQTRPTKASVSKSKYFIFLVLLIIALLLEKQETSRHAKEATYIIFSLLYTQKR